MSGTGSSRNSAAHVDSVIAALFSEADGDFLASAISREEGLFLRVLASEPDVRTTIEVGCGNGISGLYICSGLLGKDDASHIALDPFQAEDFQGRGVQNMRRAGIEFFRHIDQFSEIALPSLLAQGAQFDMALIDGLHTADQALVDFYFLDRLIRAGGIVVFDDVSSPAVNKVVRYVATYPNYELIGTSGRRGARRRAINAVKHAVATLLWPFRKVLGEPLCREVFDISLVHPELLWTIDFCTMAAFRKRGEYRRGTDWYRGI